MSGVRVLVGTRKGAFVLTADAKRTKWNVSGPHFAGWEIYHLKGSPADPDRIYASQSSGRVGQIIQRSGDGGKAWGTPGGGRCCCAARGRSRPSRALRKVANAMKDALWRRYRLTPRQNRLSAHNGCGNLLTCGDV